MSVRGIRRGAAAQGFATPTNAPIRIDSTGNKMKFIPAGTGSTEVTVLDSNQGYVADVTVTGAFRTVGGSGALVTGTLTIATGLSTIAGFAATLLAQPNATGAASPQILTVGVTTGSALVTAYSVSSVTGATIAANTATGSFTWFAYGT